jgi:Ca2+-binding EF-hand superfamily protein
VDRKNYYMSAAVGPNPFSRTSGLTQTADQTKAVSGFYGNINFEQEQHQSAFRKSMGTDLNVHNPYVAKEVVVSNLGELSGRIIQGCKEKSPGNGLRALRVALRRTVIDGMIDPVDLKYGLRAFGVELREDESAMLLKNFDPRRCGKLSVNELLHVVRSASWNSAREAIATAAYNKLDAPGNQTVTIADLEAAYNFVVNPEYQFGQKSGTELVHEFLCVWETAARDGVINLAEFLDFYKDVSPSI